MTDVVLGSHTVIIYCGGGGGGGGGGEGGGGGGGRREKGERSGDFVCVSKKCRFILAKY